MRIFYFCDVEPRSNKLQCYSHYTDTNQVSGEDYLIILLFYFLCLTRSRPSRYCLTVIFIMTTFYFLPSLVNCRAT